MLKRIDTNRCRGMDLEEFIEAMAKKAQVHYSASQLKIAFSIFQTPDMPEGYIKTESLEKALTLWGEDRLSSDKAVELLAAVNSIL